MVTKKRDIYLLIKNIFGVILIIIGIIGLLLPLMPGIIFIILGLVLLGYRKILRYREWISKKSLKTESKGLKKPALLLLRYLFILLLLLLAPVFYWILSPITIYSSAYLLKLLYEVSIKSTFIIINKSQVIEVISSCVAVAAYLLLLIINLSVEMNARKRILSIAFSVVLLLFVNIARIVLLSILYVSNFAFFDITHKIFWYFLSTLFVVVIWFLAARLFSIDKIPFYSDIKYLLGIATKKKKKN
jgi:exosortase/archaeosortase family protein